MTRAPLMHVYYQRTTSGLFHCVYLYETCDVAWSRSRHDHLHETALDVSATAHGHRSVPKVDHLGTGLPGLPL